MYKYETKNKFRSGMVVGLLELRADKAAARELNTEMLMHPGYVGFFDDDVMKARVYVFTMKKHADAMLKEAKKMGFRTAGSVEDVIHIKNSDLERPHMRYVNRGNWYKELYK